MEDSKNKTSAHDAQNPEDVVAKFMHEYRAWYARFVKDGEVTTQDEGGNPSGPPPPPPTGGFGGH